MATPDDELAEENMQYAEMATELSQPATDAPAGLPGSEGYSEYLPPSREQYEQRREPEPQYQQAPQEQRQQAQQQYNNAPDVNDDPIGHFDTRMRNHEAYLNQAHVSQQEKSFWEHVDKSENHYRGELSEGEYDAACEHIKNSRMAELQYQFPDTRENQVLAYRHGFASPAAMRQAQLQRDAIDVAAHAMRNGQTPAEAYYQLAIGRGFKPQAVMTKSYARNVMKHIDTVPDRDDRSFDEWWDKHYAPLAKSREGQR